MIINISELLEKKVTKQEFEITLDLQKFNDGIEIIEVSKPIIVKGSIRVLDEGLILKGTVEAEVILICSRCLEKFNYHVDLNFQEVISNNPDNKNDDVIFIDSNELDLDDIVLNSIIMSFPVKRLCREECNGLCQTCGANLNYSKCNCHDEDVDPRLAKLKNFFC